MRRHLDEVEGKFRDVLREAGARPPRLVAIRCLANGLIGDDHVFEAEFSKEDSRACVRWSFTNEMLIEWRAPVGFHSLEREYTRIWERCCDEHHAGEQHRDRVLHDHEYTTAMAIATTPEQRQAAYDAWQAAERRADRRAGRRSEQGSLLDPGLLHQLGRSDRSHLDTVVRRPRPGNYFSNTTQAAQRSGPTIEQMRAAWDQLYERIQPRVTRQEGIDKAEARGVELLRSWLTPEQDAQYTDSRAFEVIGSDTGNRYRIRHGLQMNIDELFEDGSVYCGWCFVPKGKLVAGDVMLAQKIALETFESDVLKEANRFEIHHSGIWMGMAPPLGRQGGTAAQGEIYRSGAGPPPGMTHTEYRQQMSELTALTIQQQMQQRLIDEASMLSHSLMYGTPYAHLHIMGRPDATPMATQNGFVSMATGV